MKILKLRFSNLNSLYGEWNIDFTESSYLNDGIFAITGPTGSGKTTIMDAVCLALYGRTPRLGIISQGTNEIMSRKTGECFSEVLFESSKGKFLCHWSQKRSYLKPDGNLQTPKHEISDVSSGKILESSSKRMVLKAVEEVTGMDFERFTRSVMLAQGGFAAFLEAEPAERSPILEQITGTEIYSKISVKIHEKTKEEKDKLAVINAGIDAVALLSDEERELLLHEKANNLKDAKEVSERIKSLNESLNLISKINELKIELNQLEIKKADALKESEEFESDFLKLNRAKKAAEIEGVYQNYRYAAEQAEKAKTEYEKALRETDNLKKEIEILTKDLNSAEDTLNLSKKEFLSEKEKIERVNSLDNKISAEEKAYSDYKRRCESLRDKKESSNEAINRLKKSLEEKNKLLLKCLDYLQTNARDSEISEILGTIKIKFSNLSDYSKKRDEAKERIFEIIANKKKCLSLLKEHTEALENQNNECQKAKETIRELEEKLTDILSGKDADSVQKEKIELERILFSINNLSELKIKENNCISQIDNLKDKNKILESKRNTIVASLENIEKSISAEERILKELEDKRVLAAKIESLEDERKNLKEGTPCPLCGSKKHPILDNSTEIPLISSDEFKIQKEKISSLNDSYLKAKEETANIKAEISQNENRISEYETLIAEIHSDTDLEILKSGDCHDDLRDKTSEYYNEISEGISQSLQLIKSKIEKSEELKKLLLSSKENLSSLKDSYYKSERDYNSAKNSFEALEKEEIFISDEINRLKEEIYKESKNLTALLSGFIRLPQVNYSPEEDNNSFGSKIELKTKKSEKYDLEKSDSDKYEYKSESFYISESENFTFNDFLAYSLDILNQLEERKENYKTKTFDKETLSKEILILEKEAENTLKLLEDTNEEISKVSDVFLKTKKELQNLRNQREILYGTKDPKEEEIKFSDKLQNAQESFDNIKGRIQTLQGSLKSKDRQKDELFTEKTRYSSTLMAKEMLFSDAVSDAGFETETEFSKALLPHEEIKNLELRRDEIEGKKKSIETMLSQRQKELIDKENNNNTEQSFDEISAEKSSAEENYKNLLSKTGAIDSRISENDKKVAELSEKLLIKNKQKVICNRWERLHSLIGSADGKKFRNFAQGLTFEIMIKNANRCLESMNDRYLLIQNPEKNLDLCVIDNYQAGEIRSTKNLSGGESFIISLALALGLSNMAGRNVKVDSLFLDEGFGTLDDDSLETAIDTLAGLKQDGKLIGVISHVSAIKERIPTKIEISKKNGGKSTLKGPGCQSL